MSSILLKNSVVVFPGEEKQNCAVLIENGLISEVSKDPSESAEVVDLAGSFLFPGFIDIHNHGAAGIDVNRADESDLKEVSRFLVSRGVTAWLPTLVPDSDDIYTRAIHSIDGVINGHADPRISRILGVHYEGAFASEKMCGALRPQFFRRFDGGNAVTPLPQLKKGIHLTTVSPEIENGIELVARLISGGWIVAIGHTAADSATLDAAYEKGARHVTHFFNAMTGLHHRRLGVAGWALTKDDVTFDIIADGHHVHPEILKLAVQTKSPKKVSLISDSVAPTGLGDGDYDLWDEKVSVLGGKTKNDRGSIAGSVITMLDAVGMMLSLGFSRSEVAQMASLNPAKLLGIDEYCGSIEKGKRADLVSIDSELNVRMAMVGGEMAVNRI